MKEEPPADYKCKDKFLIQSALVTSEFEGLSLSDLVRSPPALPFLHLTERIYSGQAWKKRTKPTSTSRRSGVLSCLLKRVRQQPQSHTATMSEKVRLKELCVSSL